METWFVLEDGSVADSREISPDAKGVLRHNDGRAVAYAPHGPRSRSVDPDKERAKRKPPQAPASEARDMQPEEPTRKYRTRETKGG